MSLSADNLAILERARGRARALLAADPGLGAALPSLELYQRVIDGRTSIEIVQRAMATYADRPALGYRRLALGADPATGRRVARPLPAFETISYRALWERIARAASGLRRGGIAGAGDLVILVGASTVDHVVAELSCHYLAAASVPLARGVSPAELALVAGECQAAALCCSVEQLPDVAAVMAACPSVRTLVAIDVVEGDEAHGELVARARVSAAAARPDLAIATLAEVEALGARGERLPPAIPGEGEDPLLSLVYTSGSTGAPKGAVFTERSWRARWSTLPFLELATLPMVSVVFLPQNHMGGRNAIANSLKLGGLACLTHGGDMSTLFEDIRLVRPTYLHLVPRLSELVYQHFQSEVARRGRARGPGAAPSARGGGGGGGEHTALSAADAHAAASSGARRDGEADAIAAEVMTEMRRGFLGDRMLLALTASAPTPPEVSAFVKRCFDIPIVDVFAGTEYGQILVDGRVNRHNVLDLRLVSVPELGYLDTDEPYPRGELHVKTARGITSYFRNEEATRALRDPDGFLRTGDIFERRGPDELVWIDRRNNVQKLAQGEFVNIWKLEALFATGSRLVKQVYIQGSSARSYLLAVIVPELAELEAELAAAASAAAAVSAATAVAAARPAASAAATTDPSCAAGTERGPSHGADQSGGEAAIKQLLRAELDRLAREHGLAPYEIPRDFLVEPEPFSRENGLLTSLNKPARPRLKARYGPALERLYEQLDRRASEAASASSDPALPAALRVRRTIAALLGLADAALDGARSFRSYGGDSIAATSLCAAVQREHGVRLSVGRVLGPEATIDAVCREVEAQLALVSAGGAAVAAAAAPTFEQIHGASPDAIRAQDLRLARFLGDHARDAPRPPRASDDTGGAPTAGALGGGSTSAGALSAAGVPAGAPADAPARSVILTGATGFLGRFLCLELLERAARAGGAVCCVVRARSDADAARRIAEVYRPGSLLHARFAALARGRLRVLAGDLERPRLGLAEARYRQLADDAGAIVHAAALVNHALPYAALFAANVAGAAEVMRLALEGPPKRFTYISTNSVSLALLGARARALESDDTRRLGDGWPARAPRHANGYQLSKWAGEVLAQDLAESYGIPVDVFRCNLILPPAGARGQLNADDFLTRLLCSVVDTGLYPGSFYERGGGAVADHADAAPAAPPHLDGFPVDFIAAAIAAIAAAPARGYAVYHVNNVRWDDGVSLDSVMARLQAAGYPLVRVDDHGAWFPRFEQALRALEPARQAASSLPILEQWRAPLAMSARRRIDAAQFRAQVQALRPGGLADIPQLDDAYFDRCIEDLRTLGLISGPPPP